MNAVIWAMRRVRDHKGGKKAFLFSNMVTDGANPNPPAGDPNTYLTQTSQFTSGGYNLQVLVRAIIIATKQAYSSNTYVPVYQVSRVFV